jgi:Tol biopolymer transport system component
MGESVRPSISADGRWVAFQSSAALDPDDTNKKTDVYVHDVGSGETARISVGPGGVEGNGGSYSPSVSGDGRYIAYWSNASNLVPDDTNKTADIFLFDRDDGSTVRLSVSDAGEQGDGFSSDPSISPDGRYVTFWSAADNLVANDTNGKRDIFLADRQSGTLRRVSVADDGTQGDGDSYSPSVSGGGGLVAFDSSARTLVSGDQKIRGNDVFLHWDDNPPTRSPA